MHNDLWKACNTCKKSINYDQNYWVCSVSTCNSKRTGLVFCTVNCWDAHVPMMRHKDAWAEERTAPSRQRHAQDQGHIVRSTNSVRRIIPSNPTDKVKKVINHETLVVASKVKSYIEVCSGMNTSGRVLEVLSEHIRKLCDDAMKAANADGRKTVLDRDFKKP